MNTYTYDALEKNGRLGNQLWQIAWQLGSASRDVGSRVSIKPDWEYRKYFSVPDEAFEPPVGNVIDGETLYYQELYHWDNITDTVYDYFQPSDLSIEYLSNNYPDFFFDDNVNKTSIHIRAGDYLEHPTRFPVPTEKYYSTAAQLVGETQFVVFSDNIDFAKNRLKGIDGDLMYVDGISRPINPLHRKGEPEDQWDMFLMSFCDQNIIGNSTFSWWGAFLAGHNQVFYPSVWFGPDLVANDSRGNDVRQSWKDGMPAEWSKVEC